MKNKRHVLEGIYRPYYTLASANAPTITPEPFTGKYVPMADVNVGLNTHAVKAPPILSNRPTRMPLSWITFSMLGLMANVKMPWNKK